MQTNHIRPRLRRLDEIQVHAKWTTQWEVQVEKQEKPSMMDFMCVCVGGQKRGNQSDQRMNEGKKGRQCRSQITKGRKVDQRECLDMKEKSNQRQEMQRPFTNHRFCFRISVRDQHFMAKRKETDDTRGTAVKKGEGTGRKGEDPGRATRDYWKLIWRVGRRRKSLLKSIKHGVRRQTLESFDFKIWFL